MAEIPWTRPVPKPPPPAAVVLLRRWAGRFFDWEDWLTLALALGAMLGVSASMEEAGWSRDMPSISLVGVLALVFALFLARSPLHMVVAWPLALVMGAAVTFWQTLEMVGPGGLEQRIDAIYFRFQAWFHLAFTGGISNDSLPFNVMVVGITWLGVFLFGWSLFRWQNAWLGLIPGGVALFMNLLFLDDTLPFPVFLYVMFGFLLVMRTNLMANIGQWRAGGVSYPPLMSLSILHYTFWAGLFLVVGAWIAPVGPFATPGPVDALGQRLEGIGVHFVRLAGPLRVKKIIPVHDYTGVLPFQGSIDLSERELLSVKVADPSIEGPIILRGAVYDEYATGGWKAGPRMEIDMPTALGTLDTLGGDGSGGRIIPVTVTVEAKSVVGTVLFTPGQPLSAGLPARAKLPQGSVTELRAEAVPHPPYRGAAFRRSVVPVPENGGSSLSDEEVLKLTPRGWHGLYVRRNGQGDVEAVGAVPASQLADVVVLSPRNKLEKGESYNVLGIIRDIPPDDLRAASSRNPSWVTESYLSLPTVPTRVSRLAWEIAGAEPNTYDRVKAIESYLRGYPVDYQVGVTPPGRDTADYFLFEAKRGYFDYHASAMVVLLRNIQIPARLAVGFVIDRQDLDRDSGSYVVQGRDAYAWVEVYFPGYGWVEFNPSPDRPAELRPTSLDDEIILPPISLEDIRDLPVPTGAFFPIGFGDLAGSGGEASSGGSGPGYATWIALAAVVLAAAVAGGATLGWRRSVADLPYPQQLWEKTVRLASWAGHPPQPGQTPADFTLALSRRHRGVRDIGLLAKAYNRSRFGRKDTDAEERTRLARIWAHLRGPLVWEVMRRPWRRS
jgi:transglutaminase-like putative cysteine protease